MTRTSGRESPVGHDSLDVEELCVDIGDVRLIERVTLRAPSASVVGLCGPNGSGKSTLLRAIYGALAGSGGAVLIGGDDLRALSARERARRVGAVLQERSTEFDYTVREMVDMGRDPHKGMFDRSDGYDRELVESAMRQVRMGALAGRGFASLSGGERQRVLIARTLAQQTPVLVLDEPTNHLDVRYQLELMELVRSLGRTVVAALHDLNLAMRYCDEVYLLAAGRVVGHGPPREVLTPARLRTVFDIEADVVEHRPSGQLHLVFLGPGQERTDSRGQPEETNR
ncbi:ABC transporter ATP-binding protein [Pseudonocardia hispaniensis]|uniref:ABC transporter ATP-binding protein n=1 Tax=Pseudonocardia hispaniensis TaxID=904933 RepID=A0ABW1IYD2_9PSEU